MTRLAALILAVALTASAQVYVGDGNPGGGGGGGGGVTTFEGRAGAVTALTGDYLVAEVTGAAAQAAIQSGSYVRCVSSAGTDTHVCGTTPALTTYTDGMVVHFEGTTAGIDGAGTLNIDSLGAIAFKKNDGTTDPDASHVAVGEPVFLVYDGTVFRLPAAGAGGSDDFGAGDPGANGLMSRDALNSSIARAIAAGVGTAIAVVNGDGVAGNPSLAVDISLETEEASPAAGDMLLIEQLVGGTLRRVPWSSLPGAAETNSLETVVTGVLADEVLVGDSADTGTFRPLPSCSVGATDKLLYNTTTNTFTCGTDGGGAETNSLETLLTAVLDDEIPVGDSLDNATFRVLPSCSTGGTDKLLYNSTTNTFSCGTDQNSGGSAHTQENIEDLQVTRTTTPVLTINTPASVSIGNSSTALSADATIDVTGGTETACTARIYVSEARALTVALSTAQCATDATVTNIAEVQASVFPDTSIPLYTWTLSGAAAWNASGTNHRGPRRDVVKGGTRINEAYVDGILSLSLGTVLVEDVENDLKTFFDCQNLVDFSTAIPATADIPSMWGEFPFAFQLTKVWCEVEENTATINLQRDDGAPADMLSSDLVCDTTEQDSCASGCDVNTIAAAEDNVAVGEQIDFNVVSIGADVNRINLCISGLVE